MPIEVTVTTEGGEAILARLESLDANTTNLLPAWREITLQLLSEEWMIFDREGAYRGREAWPQLSEAYAARKSKATRGGVTVGGSLKILELSSLLMESLTDANSADHVGELWPDSMIFGSERRVEHKGRSHNLGALHHDGKGRLPVRKALTVVDEQVEEWGEIILRHIDSEERHG